MSPLESWNFLLMLFATVGFLFCIKFYFTPESSIPPAPGLFEKIIENLRRKT